MFVAWPQCTCKFLLFVEIFPSYRVLTDYPTGPEDPPGTPGSSAPGRESFKKPKVDSTRQSHWLQPYTPFALCLTALKTMFCSALQFIASPLNLRKE